MKKVLLVLAAAGFLLATPSCKKGENDPFLSLKSRKSRLAGEYDIASWFYTITNVYTGGNSNTSTTDISGTSGTETSSTNTDGTVTPSAVRNIIVNKGSFTIEKDGTWESVMNTTTTYSEDGDDIIIDNYQYTLVETMTESGSWSFLGGQADDFKNKERVAFNSLKTASTDQTTTRVNFVGGSNTTNTGILDTYNETYAEGQAVMIYEIDQLKNKEVILKTDEGSTWNNVETEDGTIIYNYSVTSTGRTEITLSAK